MATTKAFYLTEDDAVLLRRVFQYFRNLDGGVQNSASHLREIEDPSDDIFTPEVYIAEIPVTGIPALTVVDGKYIPGKATCKIHKLWPKGLVPGTGTGTGTGTDPGEFDEEEELIETHFDHIVHNLSTTEIEGGPDLDTGTGASTGIFKIVWRDKFGRWVTEQSGAPGHVVIRFRVLSIGPFEGETSAYCLTVLAEVLDVSCNGSGVAIGDEVVIWDPDSCQFNVPSDILIGMRGTAVKMAWGDSGDATGTGTGTSTPVPGQEGGISQCVDDLGSGTGWVAGQCWWQVQTLCCGEDIYY